ncbi:hypothetical protein EJ357_44660 [Streptomyces cyaneochromogenes]|uniref:Uncharacterized protein n=1 Tax=Streptomyces cyaneochromogenes TaxID=2496836 RepID=A0A3Q9F0L8_9ACTN|nr:hypothetical protein [Streptomyces cyaneochromogenes]AZQ39656.1 hypothetical protein EJ357_44660 [Streptomyces cyaneochromogenes]
MSHRPPAFRDDRPGPLFGTMALRGQPLCYECEGGPRCLHPEGRFEDAVTVQPERPDQPGYLSIALVCCNCGARHTVFAGGDAYRTSPGRPPVYSNALDFRLLVNSEVPPEARP